MGSKSKKGRPRRRNKNGRNSPKKEVEVLSSTEVVVVSPNEETLQSRHWIHDTPMHLPITIDKVNGDMVQGSLYGKSVSITKQLASSRPLALFFYDNKVESLLTVRHVGEEDSGAYVVVSEPILGRFEVWRKANNPSDGCGNLRDKKFLLPLRSLVDNLVTILDRNKDFSFEAADILVVGCPESPSLKMGPKDLPCNLESPRSIKCLEGLATLIEDWMYDHNLNMKRDFPDLSLLVEELKLLQHGNFKGGFHFLYFLLKHPVFVPEGNKGSMFNMVTKMHNLQMWVSRENLGQVNFEFHMLRLLNYAATNLGKNPGVQRTIETRSKWWKGSIKEFAVSPIGRCLFVSTKGRRNSDLLKFIQIIQSLRNIGTHIHKYMQPGDTYVNCVKEIESKVPGIWCCLHWAILSSDLLPHYERSGVVFL